MTPSEVTIPARHREHFINDLVNGNLSPVTGRVVRCGIPEMAYWFTLVSVLRGRCNSEPAVIVRDPADTIGWLTRWNSGADG